MFIRQAPGDFLRQKWIKCNWTSSGNVLIRNLWTRPKNLFVGHSNKKTLSSDFLSKKILVSDFFGFCHNIETYWERGEWAKISRVMDRSGFVDRRRQRRRRRWRCCHPSRLNCQLSSSLRRFDVVTKSGETNWVNDVWTRLTFSWILNFSSNFLG